MTAWRFGSYDLNSFGTLTLIDEYLDIPDSRGDNITIPFRHGRVFVPKYFDERVLLFGMTISQPSKTMLEPLIETLKGILVPRTQQTLYKILPDGSIQTAQATVEKALGITRPAPWVAKASIEFSLPTPFFRLSTAIADNTTTIDASPKAMTVINPGTMDEYDPIITLTGPLTNVVITHTINGCVLTYTGVISAGHNVVIQTSAAGEYTATHSVSGNVIGNVSHSGSPALLVLNTQSNPLSITSDVATTGTVKISFNPPYI